MNSLLSNSYFTTTYYANHVSPPPDENKTQLYVDGRSMFYHFVTFVNITHRLNFALFVHKDVGIQTNLSIIQHIFEWCTCTKQFLLAVITSLVMDFYLRVHQYFATPPRYQRWMWPWCLVPLSRHTVSGIHQMLPLPPVIWTLWEGPCPAHQLRLHYATLPFLHHPCFLLLIVLT